VCLTVCLGGFAGEAVGPEAVNSYCSMREHLL